MRSVSDCYQSQERESGSRLQTSLIWSEWLIMFTPTTHQTASPPSPRPILKPSIVMTITGLATEPEPEPLAPRFPRSGPVTPVGRLTEGLRWELSEVGTISQHDANITIKKLAQILCPFRLVWVNTPLWRPLGPLPLIRGGTGPEQSEPWWLQMTLNIIINPSNSV